MKKSIILLAVSLLMTLFSCNNWLDVKPSDSIVDEELFKAESGFKQVLAGAYIAMTSENLYAVNAQVGVPDALARYWKLDLQTNRYFDIAAYDFATSRAEGQLNAIWDETYAIIANLNSLLDNLEKTPEDSFKDYRLIKGEALGLRAYLHLDLFRLFGPVLKERGMQAPSIPYRNRYDNTIVRIMPAIDVLNAAEKDLLEAYACLKEDPVNQYGRDASRTNMSDNSMAYNFRGIRMNYYAVAATLARLYQLKEDSDNAYKYAKEVIDANTVFDLVHREDIVKSEGDRDLMFQRELVFALYDKNLKPKLGRFMGYGEVNQIPNLPVGEEFYNWVYVQEGKGTVEDYRYQYLWNKINQVRVLYKYYRNVTEEDRTPYKPLYPMIRLSEMYYIASEAVVNKNKAEALDLLNAVRVSRNISSLTPDDVLTSEMFTYHIVAEQLKEFWGEGKMFYTYKRLFHDILQHGGHYKADTRIFELPIPKDEYEFSNN